MELAWHVFTCPSTAYDQLAPCLLLQLDLMQHNIACQQCRKSQPQFAAAGLGVQGQMQLAVTSPPIHASGTAALSRQISGHISIFRKEFVLLHASGRRSVSLQLAGVDMGLRDYTPACYALTAKLEVRDIGCTQSH
jgi:hypothetical protein